MRGTPNLGKPPLHHPIFRQKSQDTRTKSTEKWRAHILQREEKYGILYVVEDATPHQMFKKCTS